MSEPKHMAIPTSYGIILIAPGRIEHSGCNTKIGLQAAQDLDLEAEILAPDRLRIHPPSHIWSWTEYHHHYVELLVDNGLDH